MPEPWAGNIWPAASPTRSHARRAEAGVRAAQGDEPGGPVDLVADPRLVGPGLGQHLRRGAERAGGDAPDEHGDVVEAVLHGERPGRPPAVATDAVHGVGDLRAVALEEALGPSTSSIRSVWSPPRTGSAPPIGGHDQASSGDAVRSDPVPPRRVDEQRRLEASSGRLDRDRPDRPPRRP